MVVLAAMLFMVGTVAADGGPHGGFTATTQKCQACHSPHRAGAMNLLRGTSSTVYDFCTVCHGTGGDAHTDVQSGSFTAVKSLYPESDNFGTPGKQLNAGKFVLTNNSPTRSTHSVVADPTGTTAWGGDNLGNDPIRSNAFTCASCHDPHGMALPDGGSQTNGGTDQYRLLITGGNVLSWESVGNTGAAKSYTQVAWKSGMAGFCASCHVDYMTSTPATSTTPNRPSGTKFAHPVDVPLSAWGVQGNLGNSDYKLPVEQPAFHNAYTVSGSTPVASGAGTITGSYDPTDEVTCTTCHNPHGSEAVEANRDWTAQFNAAGDASLLRFSDRTVCQSCHKKGF